MKISTGFDVGQVTCIDSGTIPRLEDHLISDTQIGLWSDDSSVYQIEAQLISFPKLSF